MPALPSREEEKGLSNGANLLADNQNSCQLGLVAESGPPSPREALGEERREKRFFGRGVGATD
jgi:hypothetical protein